MASENQMEYVNLGNSGLMVSRIGLGNWLTTDSSQEEINKVYKAAWDAGVNFFDTAEMYEYHKGERVMGEAIRSLNIPRSEYIVTTKLFFGNNPEKKEVPRNDVGANKKHLIEGMNKSLESLGMDHIDIVYVHRYDYTSSTLEVCQAMKQLIKTGKTFYWGTSEWPAIRIMEAIKMCDKIDCPRPIVEQPMYNYLNRQKMEVEYAVLFDDYKLGATTWSPLMSGFLTGKSNKEFVAGTRFTDYPILQYMWGLNDQEHRQKLVDKLDKQKVIADELGATLAQLAVAWCIFYPNCTLVQTGARNAAQITDTCAAVGVYKKMTKETVDRMEEILGSKPETEMNWKTFAPDKSRR